MTDASIVWWNTMFIQEESFFYFPLTKDTVGEYIVWNLLWGSIFPDGMSEGQVAMSVFAAADEEGKRRIGQCW
jgi:hypothetical protein